MAIRLSGLTSGMDTDAIVQELVSAYRLKTQKYEKASTKLTWKQDTWKSLNTKIYNLYTKVSNMRFSSAYNLRKTSVSDATKATVTASSSAVTGTQKLNIKSTAQSSYMTGGVLPEFIMDKKHPEVPTDTTLEELGYTGNYTNIKYKTADGETKEIGVNKDTTISEVINKLKEVGLNASFDENNRRIFVNAKTSGAKSDFTLVGDSVDALNALSALGLDTAMVEYERDENGNIIYDAQGNAKKKFTDAAGSFAAYYEYYKEAFTIPPERNDFAISEDGAVDIEIDEEAYKAALEAYTLANSNIEYDSLTDEEKIKYGSEEGYNTARDAAKETVLLNYMEKMYDKYRSIYKANDETKVSYRELENDNKAWAVQIERLETQKAAKTSFDNIWNKVVETKGDTAYTQDEVSSMLKAIGSMELYTTDEDGNKIVSEEAITAIETAYKETNVNGFDLADGEAEALIGIFGSSELEEDVKTATQYMKTSDDITKLDLDIIVNGDDLSGTKGINDIKEQIAKNEAQLETWQGLMDEYEAFLSDNAEMAEIEPTDEDGNYDAAGVRNALAKFVDKAQLAAEIYENDDYLTGNAVKITGSNAEIELNGATYTSETNSFAINGLTINTLATTNGEISITTTVDTQGIYDKVKEFLTEYNNVINEMTKLYNADSASDYEPLTDEEKEAMSDEQIEKWETKIKDSLLRRDTTLNSIMSVMVNSMAQVIEIDGQKLSLSTFGIHTLGFLNAPKNEHYAFHIDGDEDDENTSGEEDELMKAIEANPDQVEAFMKKLCENLYTAIDDKMKSTELSSVYKVYNDKEMDRELKKYAETIAKWEDKVADKEEYYYNKFSQMEVALSKLQNQTSSISGLLGM